jgi:hypothetical protein
MENILNFFVKFEVWIYLLLSIVGILTIRKVFLALQEWRSSVFGLEKEYAQRRFSGAMSIILLLLFFGFAEFIFVTFIAPGYPTMNQITTPTIDLLATREPTLEILAGTVNPQPTNLVTGNIPNSEGCIPGQLEWVDPVQGAEISGTVELKATINMDNMGFFKYEFSSTNGERYVTIAANTGKKVEEVLGVWDTTQLIPGDYLLRLIVTDNKGDNLPECRISIRIISP